jgi:hypothetical protein
MIPGTIGCILSETEFRTYIWDLKGTLLVDDVAPELWELYDSQIDDFAGFVVLLESGGYLYAPTLEELARLVHHF